MKNKATASTEIIEFEIGEIPVQEAMRLVAAGGGKYGTLAEQLIARLEKRQASDPLPIFKFPGPQELPDSERRGICMAVGSAFKRAGVPYRITYSSERKLFVVIPRQPIKHGKPVDPPTSKVNPRRVHWTLKTLAEYASEVFGVSVREIQGRGQSREVTSARAAFARYAIDHKQSKNLAQFLNRDMTGLYRLQPEPGDLERLDARVNQNGSSH